MISKEKGFTLVELMVAMALSGLVIAAVYVTFSSQSKVFNAQDQVTEMQQDVRAAVDIITKEIRMAGFDPYSANNLEFVNTPANGRTTSATSCAFTFASDINGNGQITAGENEEIAFKLNVDKDTGLALPNGNEDWILRRFSIVNNRWDPLSENIRAIGFAYAFDNDLKGGLDTHAGTNNIIWATDLDGNGTLEQNLDTNLDGEVDATDTVGGAPMASSVGNNRIRAVRFWVLARSKSTDKEFQSTRVFRVGSQDIDTRCVNAANDLDRCHYRYRLLTATVNCRNMGL